MLLSNANNVRSWVLPTTRRASVWFRVKIKQFTTTRTSVVQIKVAEMKLRVEDQLIGTDKMERFAGHTNDVAMAVVGISVRTINANLTHVLCHMQ